MNFLVEPSTPLTLDPFESGDTARCGLTCSLTCNLDGSCSNLSCGLIIEKPKITPADDRT
jgi:hypothetical protein